MAIFAAIFSHCFYRTLVYVCEVSLHMNDSQITDIYTGKMCGQTGKKSRENTGNLNIKFEWAPSPRMGQLRVVGQTCPGCTR